ncbi:DNA-processing protein DprA [Skermania piniformis]|uniref:DNA-processing protein DprA n=1 Tax=Skermania pinensis TaxID=39122 RepID=A0ABX8S4C4_9ACTN|nr:DNA-processing protein DprA [Skermania piniformis]QXQ12693.1 DNA-processing protein DprA [Skermania piniformis]
MNDELLAWAYLSRVVQGPCAPLAELITRVGVIDAARAVREWTLPAVLRRRTEARRHLDTAAADLALLDRLGGRLVTPDDPDWPAWRMLAFAAPGRDGGRDGSAPLALWVRGAAALAGATDRAVAVVGTRAPSGYGVAVAGELAGDLAADGWTIVSGAALGIDAAAHRAALAVGGCTIAVLACGVDLPYPAQHTRLLAEIAESGLVISEYPPGIVPARYRFLERNRHVAGLADAVVVVEAGWRSGARNTAAWARRLGRPALAVPGSVSSAASTGCHQMIREGEARLVTRASEIVDEAGPLRLPIGEPVPDRPTDRLSGDQLSVYEALPAVGAREPRQLAELSGVSLPQVRATLPLLELAGFAGVDDTGWFRRRPRSSGAPT